jgi:hypothetical protein
LSERKDFNPTRFCFSYKDWDGNPVNVGIQQDSSEFVARFFDKLEGSLSKSPFKTILDGIYCGKTCDWMCCQNCGHERTRVEKLFYLSLEVKNIKNIEEGLEKYISSTTVSDYMCESCEKRCDVVKRCFIEEPANVFVIHLQRIIFDLDYLINVKVNGRWEFPFNLNVKKYTKAYFDNERYPQPDPAQANVDGHNESTEQNAGDQPEPETTIQEEMLMEKKNSIDDPDLVIERKDSMRKDSEAHNAKDNEPLRPTPPVMHEDEFYEYTLGGVVCHYGSSEVGHYYSYINVNRNDPYRNHLTKEKWLEFNDSRITEFDLKNFDEACFGSGTGNDSNHDEFDTMANKFERLNSNKSAYILVYERKEKSNLKFQFNEENIDQKADIINNLLKKENLDPSVLTDDKNMELEIKFNDIKAYMPAKYYNEILEDNFKFQMEQQIYTKEF